jgi:hypothetical protein
MPKSAPKARRQPPAIDAKSPAKVAVPAPKAAAFVNQVLDQVAVYGRRGPADWHGKLPAEYQAACLEFQRRLRAGELTSTKTALAKTLYKELEKMGLITVGWREVLRWLEGTR